MSCESEEQEKTPTQHLQNMLQKFRPKQRYVSEMHVEQFIDTIYLQIVNGDTEISSEKTSYEHEIDKKNDFQYVLKQRVLQHAEKQKKMLQDKLLYLDRSINMLFKDQDHKHPKSHRHSISISSPGQAQPWRKQIKERSKNIQKKKKQIQEMKRKKQQEYLEMEARIKKQKQEARKKQLQQHLQKIGERAKERQQIVKSANDRYNQMKKNKSLYQKMNESYNEKQSAILQERKKKLAQIRNLHKPLNNSEIQEHQQKFLQLKRQKEQMRQRQKRMNDSRSNSYQPFYRSAFYRRALQNSRNQVENSQLVKREKMKQFSDHVKESFAPETDEKKREAIQQFIEKQRKKAQLKFLKEQELLGKSRNKGLQYLEQIKKIPKNKNKRSNSNSQSLATNKVGMSQYENYLTHSQEKPQDSSKKWVKILEDGSSNKQQKALLMQYQSSKREQELKRKEQQVRILKNGESEQIDQEYYKMIKAKLDLLQTDK